MRIGRPAGEGWAAPAVPARDAEVEGEGGRLNEKAKPHGRDDKQRRHRRHQ